MTKDDLLNELLGSVKSYEGVESASRIDGEDAVGVELTDGSEYFIEIQLA